jgi:hypothetical protein
MKPVAWMYEVNDTFILFSANKPPEDAYDEGSLVPLYTAPRELSDEEILDCLEKSDLPMILLSDFATEKMKVFARAILKKASEK